MNRALTVLLSGTLAAGAALAATNVWDGVDLTSRYNGAFGNTNGIPDYSTSTNIVTQTPGNPDGLGYFQLLNRASTTITVTNDFKGFISTQIGSGSAITLTINAPGDNQVVGTVANGAVAGRGAGRTALNLSVTNSPARSDNLNLNGGRYVGGAGSVAAGTGSDAAVVRGWNQVSVNSAGFQGGAGAALANNGSDLTANGGNGLYVLDSTTIVVSNANSSVDEMIGGAGGTANQTTVGKSAFVNGGNALRFDGSSTVGQQMSVKGGLYTGGKGGGITATGSVTSEAKGGSALLAKSASHVMVDSGQFTGGTGGAINSAGSTARAGGGSGIELVGITPPTIVDDATLVNTVAQGGNGGTITNVASASATGGDGVLMGSSPPMVGLVIDGGAYTGGTGGTGQGSASAEANGGNGVSLAGPTTTNLLVLPTTLRIESGIFTGGNGGTASSSAGTVSAAGGNGVLASYADVTIHGGTFTGAAGGTKNGAAGVAGAGLKIVDSKLSITDGTFNGLGLWAIADATNKNNVIDISGGTFGATLFDATGQNNVNVAGGSFSNLQFTGSGVNAATLSGNASVGDLSMSGTGTFNLSIASNVVFSGKYVQTGGTASISQWSDSHFKDTTVSSGTINFSGRQFNLADGRSFKLNSPSGSANFNNGLVVGNGGNLEVTGGNVFAPDLLVNAGANMTTTNGSLLLGNNMTFNTGIQWSLLGTPATNFFTLAIATNSMVQNLQRSDFVLGSTKWYQGVNNITNIQTTINTLRVYYGDLALSDVIDAPAGSEFSKAIASLNSLVLPGSKGYTNLIVRFGSSAEASTRQQDAYVETPEVASTLIRLQTQISGQIVDRTRSYRTSANWGVASTGPQGPNGPDEWYGDVKEWANEHLPSWDARGAVRHADDRAPRPSLKGDLAEVNKPYMASDTTADTKSVYSSFRDWLNGLLPEPSAGHVEIPSSYQVWGRGYYSWMDQKSDGSLEGYDANIAGGVIGIDRNFDNLLVGIAGGFARTTLNGNNGNDADVDTGYGSIYATVLKEGFFLDLNANYGISQADTESDPIFGYKGKYDAGTTSLYAGGGLALRSCKDRLLLTPEASLLATYYKQDAYTETSSQSLPAKNWDDYDQWSYLGSLGAVLSFTQKIQSFKAEMEFRPEIRAHWLHEFNANMDKPVYSMVPGSPIGATLQARQEDLADLGAGVSFAKWESESLELGVDVDGIFGQDYTAYVVSGKLLHRF